MVDDGSDDDTSGRARSLTADLPHHRVIRLRANQGKGAAVRAGIRAARGSSIAYMDADMAIDPRAIPLLLEQLVTNEAAIGSRSLPDSMVESRYMIRLLMGRLFNRLVTAGTELDFPDPQLQSLGAGYLELLRNLRPALRPDARIGVIDRNGTGTDHGVNASVVIHEMDAAGFALSGRYDFTRADGQDYFLIFTQKR